MARGAVPGGAVSKAGRPRPDPCATSGWTFVEMAFVLALIGVVSLLIVEAVATMNRANSYCRGQVRLAEAADSVARAIVDDVAASIRVFSNDAPSTAYWEALELGTATPLAGMRRPQLSNLGCIDPDGPGAELTGNHLLLAQRCQPMTLCAPATATAPELTTRIDLFRFVTYYPTEQAGRHDHSLDLARICSMPLAAVTDLTAIADLGQRARICVALREFGVRHAWNPTQERSAGLYKITPEGGLVLLGPGIKVERDVGQSREALLGPRRLGLARNGSVPGTPVPLYARAATGADGSAFPGGFEVRVDGPTSGRMVMLRLVITARSSADQLNWNEIRRIVACHDG